MTAEELAELVPRLYRLLRTALDVEPGSPSLEQLRVMHRIDEGLHHVSALANARQMRMSAITAILDVLVDREWVQRVPDTVDRRRTFVDLTPSGREALARGRGFTTQRMATILEGLPDSVADAVRALMHAVAEFDAHREPAGSGGREAQANRSMQSTPATRQ